MDGFENKIRGDENIIGGDKNKAKGNRNFIKGDGNIVEGEKNYINGEGNIVVDELDMDFEEDLLKSMDLEFMKHFKSAFDEEDI